MHSSIQALVEEQLRNGLPALAGASVRGTLPVTDALLSDVFTVASARDRGGAVQLRSMTVLPDNRLRLDIAVRALFLSRTFSPEIRLLEVGGLPGRLSLTAVLPAQYAVVLSRLLRQQIDPGGSLLSFDGRTVTIWVDVLLQRRWGDAALGLLALLKVASFRTETGTLFLDFEARVP